MLSFLPQILFAILAGVSVFFFVRNIRRIRRNIMLGRAEDRSDNPGKRWKNVALIAFGQRKMWKRPIPAVLHFFVYAGFVLINIEILEIVVDGLAGKHRTFSPLLGDFYPWVIGFFEVLAVLTLVAVIAFLIRRNVLRLRRLNTKELDGFPRRDANTILIVEVVLMTMLLLMNIADTEIMEHEGEGVHHFLVTGLFAGVFDGLSTANLHLLERVCWWGHILGVFAFLNYLPFSKHFHIITAFPAAYYTRLAPQGKMGNMKDVQDEVLYAMDPSASPPPPAPGEQAPTPGRFGAKDVQDLSWKNLLDAYSCTQCGRCTAVCPANLTGKALNPRKIMMDTRGRLEEVGRNIDKNGAFQDDGKSLVHDYITTEELRACTTCNACVESCPVGIEPLSIINQTRRYLVMEESNAPGEWNSMFSSIENNMAPWKFSPDERDKWAEEMSLQ